MTTSPGNPFTVLARTIKDHTKRIKVAEQRINAIDTKLSKARNTLGTLTPAQMTALATFTAAQLNDLASLTTGQIAALSGCSVGQLNFLAGLSGTQESFLSGLSVLGHQTTSNNNIASATGTLTATDRTSLNGLINAVNTLMGNLQSDGFQS